MKVINYYLYRQSEGDGMGIIMNTVDSIICEFKSYKNSLNPKLRERIFPKDNRVRLKNIETLVNGILCFPSLGLTIVFVSMLTEEIKTADLLIILLLITMAFFSICLLFVRTIINDILRGLIGPKFFRKYVQTVYRKVFERDKLVLKKIIANRSLDLEIICKRIECRSEKRGINGDSFSANLISITSLSISIFTIISTNFRYIIEFIKKQFEIFDEKSALVFIFLLIFGVVLYFFLAFQTNILYFQNIDFYLYQLVEEILYCDISTEKKKHKVTYPGTGSAPCKELK